MKVYELMAFLAKQQADATVYVAGSSNAPIATLLEIEDDNAPDSISLIGAGDFEED